MIKGIGGLSSITPQRAWASRKAVVATSALITEVLPEGVLRGVVEAAAAVISARYAAIGVPVPDGRVMESFDSTYDFSASSDGAPSLSQLRNVPGA